MTRRTKGYRRSGYTEERIKLDDLSGATERNGTLGFHKHTQPPNHGYIQRTIDVDVRAGAGVGQAGRSF